MTSSKIRYFTGACTFQEHICIEDVADNHSDTIWAQGWMSVVRPMSRLGTLAFKVPIKVPALGTVPFMAKITRNECSQTLDIVVVLESASNLN